MNDTIAKPQGRTDTGRLPRWRNKWRVPEAHPVCMITGLPLHYAGEPDTYWSLITWPSKDVAEAKAAGLQDDDAIAGGDEYLGAYPCP